MLHEFRAVAVDYDGTIAEGDRPNPTALDALAVLRASGMKILLCTGRILDELRTVFPDVDRHFDALVVENGGVVVIDSRAAAAVEPLPGELATALRERDVPFRAGSVLVATDARPYPAARSKRSFAVLRPLFSLPERRRNRRRSASWLQSTTRTMQWPSRPIRSARMVPRACEEIPRTHAGRFPRRRARADGAELINRILVAGPVAIVAEFQRRLPGGLRRRVSSSMRVSTTASASDVLEASKVVEAEIERSGEVELIEQLLENFDGSRVGALGVAEAVADPQVQTLVYARGTTLSGAECVGCGWLVPQDTFSLPEACPRCGAELRSHEDLLDTMVKLVREHGGRVEEVRGEAAERLAQLEGVGALLRYTSAAQQTGADVSVS